MLTLVVLYVSDVDTMPGGAVLELYPASGRSTRTRLGFMVGDRAAVADALPSAGFTVKRQLLVIDPDGNMVRLDDSEGISQRETEGALAAGLGREQVEWLDDGADAVVDRP